MDKWLNNKKKQIWSMTNEYNQLKGKTIEYHLILMPVHDIHYISLAHLSSKP